MGVCLDKESRKSNVTPTDENDVVPSHRQKGKPYFRNKSLKAKDVLSAKQSGEGKTKAGDEVGVIGDGGILHENNVTSATSFVEPIVEELGSPIEGRTEIHRDLQNTSPIGSISSKMAAIPALTKPAPDFSGTAVVNGAFKEIKLSDYKGRYLVLFFYPLDFTFVCPTEIISFSDKVDEFKAINCELIACSTDSQYSHFAWVSTSRKQGGLGSLNIPLLADKTGKIARDYGCYKEDEGIAFRGLYIIDDKGTLRQITINDLPVGRSVEETLRLVQAFQYTDQHGEVCPANWKPGAKTMKPDPHGSLEYFEKEN